MLARANRLLTADDIRNTMRRGRRVSGSASIVHIVVGETDRPPRCGFVVSKKVGNAVTRNRVRRRLRAICRDVVSELAPGTDVVIRALPESAHSTWASLQGEISAALSRRTRA
ncbi:MAG: ribonuclease P protein component [Cryobacterium sp.]|nr:ribonuclease P protein component [Cryobacterium sp.]